MISRKRICFIPFVRKKDTQMRTACTMSAVNSFVDNATDIKISILKSCENGVMPIILPSLVLSFSLFVSSEASV